MTTEKKRKAGKAQLYVVALHNLAIPIPSPRTTAERLQPCRPPLRDIVDLHAQTYP